MSKSLNKKSKFLSAILRHKPELANLKLDQAGWTDVSILLKNTKMDIATLEEVVATNNKKRFEFNSDKSKIRARQGHSVKVDLGYQPANPPEMLYHGTAAKNIDSIMSNGIVKGDRHHVHLSPAVETAMQVGQRHGKPVVLLVKAAKMVSDLNAKFFKTENGVWLTDHVPSKYLEIYLS